MNRRTFFGRLLASGWVIAAAPTLAPAAMPPAAVPAPSDDIIVYGQHFTNAQVRELARKLAPEIARQIAMNRDGNLTRMRAALGREP